MVMVMAMAGITGRLRMGAGDGTDRLGWRGRQLGTGTAAGRGRCWGRSEEGRWLRRWRGAAGIWAEWRSKGTATAAVAAKVAVGAQGRRQVWRAEPGGSGG